MPLPIWPIDPTPGAVVAGGNLLIINGFCGEGGAHKAIDIRIYFPETPETGYGEQEALPVGTNVVAIAAGTVQASGAGGDRGNYVQIIHDTATPVYISRYLHLSSTHADDNALPNVGDVVTQGQLIGKSGNTGTSDAAHLHFDLFLGSVSPSNALDPCHYLPHLDGLYHCSIQGSRYDLRCNPILPTCWECTQAQAQGLPVELRTPLFAGISNVVYSVITSQGNEFAKDCIVTPDIDKPATKPGINPTTRTCISRVEVIANWVRTLSAGAHANIVALVPGGLTVGVIESGSESFRFAGSGFPNPCSNLTPSEPCGEDPGGGGGATCGTIQIKTATVGTNHTSVVVSLPTIPTTAEACVVIGSDDPFTDYVTFSAPAQWQNGGAFFDGSHGATPWECDNKAEFIATANIIHVQIYVGALQETNCAGDDDDAWVAIGYGYVECEGGAALFYHVNVPSSLCLGGNVLNTEVQAFANGGSLQDLTDAICRVTGGF